ncbi:MAG TPA: MBL fold metallo-hydrolase [bacterium]|nr:MBL fold metallo-hydrolase [bacterium]HOB72189.1 MBL fold metallo-hydrolase [bacterium]HOG44181.1 MBL fold metallo-hydrolase [bacterium]HPM45494.1 MBL fold metallo-hydrolase [bacterium]HPV21767.1 MBL fold metallo-hydrolase [bacterium]
MNRIHILSSGSKANAFILESDREMILIDQGLSFKEFQKRADGLGVDVSKIKGILLTHEHTDHSCGIPYTAFKLGVPVYSTEKTISIINSACKYDLKYKCIDKDVSFSIGNFSCIPFEIMHDAADPVGFLIRMGPDQTLCFATDTGKVTNRMMSYISRCDHIILEANHDHSMLYANRKYPAELKARIRGSHGHLSNDQSLEIIDRMGGKCPRTIIFSHLSEENNSPDLLSGLIEEFKKKNSMFFNSFIARQNLPFTVYLP